jgi:hypothetical protein
MSEFITVRAIGDDEVRIIEDSQKKWSWRCSAAWVLSLVGSMVTGALIIVVTCPEQIPFPHGYFIMVAPGIVYLEVAFLMCRGWLFDHISVYEVYLQSDVFDSVTIPKTGTYAEGVAICKAVKKYEKIAQDREDDKIRLIEIVGKCK